MGLLRKLVASLQPERPAMQPSAAPSDVPAFLWQSLDAPGGTHMQFLDRDFVPNGVIEAIVRPPRSVLDVGCYCGGAAVALKRRWPDAHVTGIEPLAAAAEIARTRVDRVFVGKLEDAAPSDLAMPAAGFDTIICADVLEHMYNPWSALTRLRAMLADDGVLIASIPNARNLALVRDLACHGRWEYVGAGLLDITHIRFFTAAEIRTLFRDTGFTIEAIANMIDPRFVALAQSTEPMTRLQVDSLTLEGLTPGDRIELATLQFVVRAAKAGR